jgi:hypothetical protein
MMAVFLDLGDLLWRLDFKTAKQEGGFDPRTIELDNIHSKFQQIDGDFFGHLLNSFLHGGITT